MLQSIREIGCYTFSASEDAIDPSEMKRNSIVIFDDCINDREINKTVVRNIFTLGRHRCIDVVYLVQCYSMLAKRLQRDNANFIIIFGQDDLNLKHIYNDFGVNADMTFNQFR